MPDQTPREQLARIIGTPRWHTNESGGKHNATADAVIAAGWRPPARVITTASDRDALPIGTVVRSDAGFVAVRVNDHSGEVPGRNARYPWDCIVLPVTVLYAPIAVHTPENGDTP